MLKVQGTGARKLLHPETKASREWIQRTLAFHWPTEWLWQAFYSPGFLKNDFRSATVSVDAFQLRELSD